MSSPVYAAAIDLGATSGRVVLGKWAGQSLTLNEVHRFPNALRALGAHVYWDLGMLWHEVRTGLGKASAALPRGAKLASVGVDTWGVDYALVNASGRLVFPVHSYRDARTQAGCERLARTPAALERIYAATGIANHFYNTSHQLAEVVAHCPAIIDQAARCLFLPDYFNFLLSGRMENELTVASSSQLLAVGANNWSRVALDHFHIPPRWFTKPVVGRTKLGRVRDFAALASTEVIAVPGHDTACAFDAMPAAPGCADLFISSGTWSILGFESDAPVLGAAALAAGINNERTGDSRFRPLTNIVGLWLIEQTLICFTTVPYTSEDWAALVVAASKLRRPAVLLDVSDPGFANPPSMRDAIDAQLKKKGALPPRGPAGYARLIYESLGQGHADALRSLQALSGRKFECILIGGGGSRNQLLCQATADAAGLPVMSFELEGSVVGNFARQLIALGVVKDLVEFRSLLATRLERHVYFPRL